MTLLNAVDGVDATEVRRAVAAVRPGRSDDPAAANDAFARAAWSCIAEAGDGAAGALVNTLGPNSALHRLVRGGRLSELPATAAALESLAARWRPRLDSAAVFRAMRNAAQLGAVLVLPGDADWPAGFADLGPHAPLALWVIAPGRRLPEVSRAIALVGARAATNYGESVAMEAAAGLSDRGFTVVSGAAYGIDGAAHRATLASDGTTVAVLAGGVDRFYPSGHADLIRRIADTGAVIAESPCGTTPHKSRFLQRNRLIAAMSRATVVVEAGHRSGSLNTAGHAAALGRAVGAVPGSVHSAASVGCHRLLREYGAICVCDAAEMAELIDGVQEQPVLDGLDDVDPLEQRVLEVLGSAPRSTLELAQRAALSEREVAGAVGALVLTGAADKVPTGWIRARRR
ncbi:DNA-processing protein DprA [uncultured Amnibacterium sp.]|uniref:DNA-processing protein DprA n=1 Tax=uncultured Amnibacterium sp. TaxID=1631851 RepID=UPI0035C96DE4